MTRVSFYLVFWRGIVFWSHHSKAVCYRGILLISDSVLLLGYHENLVSVLIPSSFTDAKYPVDIKLSAYQKWYCGFWVSLSCSWYVLILTAHWPENTHCKPEKKMFICPWLFFLLVVRIKWNNVCESTLYTVSYQCKMLRCVVISLVTSLFRMEFPMHYYS